MHRRILFVIPVLLLMSFLALAATAPQPVASNPTFDVKTATDAYLNSVPADARARSNAYFEGGYWLLLWDFLLSSVVALILLTTRLSAKMRNLAERVTRFKPLHTFLYWVQYLLITSLLTLPMTIYEGFFRERKYALMNQTFGSWFGDQLIELLVNLILVGALVVALFSIVRRLPNTWWAWGTAVTVVFIIIVALIAPVYIAPLFNKYTKLTDEKVRQPILSLARANGVPATEVWQVDASRQSNRVSANVSGFLGTERITLNDNLLKRCTLEEIESVMGHEMGHYVMNHVYKAILFFALESMLFFAVLRWSLNWSLAKWGERWGIHGNGDPAVLPLVVLIAGVFFFLLTPVNNTFIRTQEYEADIFGLDAAAQPDGEAKVDLMLAEYRKLDPTPLEEFIFYDHPSGRTRINAAMRWKAEHLNPSCPTVPTK